MNAGTDWPKIILISLGVLCALTLIVALVTAPAPPFSKPRKSDEKPATLPIDELPGYKPPAVTGYVGSMRCAGCHADIAESFKSHPMANSASLIDASSITPEQLKQTRVPGKQRVLDVTFRDGVLEHHERMFDAEGKEIYDQAVPMKFSMGSGRRAKAYVHEAGDLLFMSPLNWYSQAAKWDLAPNYKPDDDRRFDRRVTDECLSCHTGRVNSLARSSNRYKTPVFHELSIGCENCHGPGEKHVAYRESNGTGEDPIVNPAKLEPLKRESVCNQCHLQTTVRSLRYLRSHLDFRPGQNLQDIWVVLDTHLGVGKDGRTRSVNHVQQMRASRCFTASEGKFGCTSCHDPHRVPAEADRVNFYRQRCAKCHQDSDCHAPADQRQQQQNSCIACHMPSRNSTNISHVTQTDHRILRDPQTPVKSSPEDADEELRWLDENPAVPLADWEKERALGLGAWIYLTKQNRKAPETLAKNMLRVLHKVEDDPATLLMLGSLGTEYKRYDQALDYYDRARKIPASEEEALWGLLNLYYEGGHWGPAQAASDGLVKIDTESAKLFALRAEILSRQDQPKESLLAAEKSLKLNPALIPVREWLIKAYEAAGRTEDARAQQELIKRLQSAKIPEAKPE